jgi:hypothetical protein
MKFTARRNSRRFTFLSLVLAGLLLSAGLFTGVSVEANGNSTLTALDVSPSVTTFGDPVTLTATVTANTGTPTGSVEFFDYSTSLGSEPLAAGTAIMSISTLEPGAHEITASYSGDSNLTASTSPVMWVSVFLRFSQTTLIVAPEPSLTGQTVTFTASVVPVPTCSVTPSGSVNFNIQGGGLNRDISGNLDVSGTATANLSDLPAGTYAAIATYLPTNGYYMSSSTEFSFQVNASGPPRGVGGEVQGINKPWKFIAWISLVLVLIIGGVVLAGRRKQDAGYKIQETRNKKQETKKQDTKGQEGKL